MKFLYGKQDLRSLERAQESCFLLTNGLGGYLSQTVSYSAPRADQGLLVAAVKAPNERVSLVHRMSEQLTVGQDRFWLSSQAFADGRAAEDGWRHLSSFTYEHLPCWRYQAGGVTVTRRCAMAYGENTSAILYSIENHAKLPCTLTLRPLFKFDTKEKALTTGHEMTHQGTLVSANGYALRILTDGALEGLESEWEILDYSEDAKDGRPDKGVAGSCLRICRTVQPGQQCRLEVVFTLHETALPAQEIWEHAQNRLFQLEKSCGFDHPVARQLAVSADAYIARRDSTGGKTILAGYPLFSDWGRDTMIALPGCVLATGRYEEARSILRTFLAYEKDGLVPNLFPEGEAQPMYNTVDAALLLIDCVWQYIRRTGDLDFAREAWPVMERIIACYRAGTHHSIGIDADGLIYAGGGLDQVTWMDVCVQGILPTPRHGKPVEINAYWYNALRVMEALAQELAEDGRDYGQLAALVADSFVKAFYMEDKGYLRDVISGTKADEQLRCNQIWAVSMSFTMLSPRQEAEVVETVLRHLHTPCGLRTLSPSDPEYHPHYGGPQLERDMAYHQGTTWVFPMGAYYLAWLKVHGRTPEAAQLLLEDQEALLPMMREGCVGQLPEIYDGSNPCDGKGCFAQAWSVGEMLRVFEAIQAIEKKTKK